MKNMENMENIVVLILAGGLGKRMKSELPKVLHKLDTKSMLSTIIETASHLPHLKILVVVGKYHPIIQETLKKEIPNLECNIEYVIQEKSLGTGHAVISAKEHVKDITGDILILNGDAPLVTDKTLLDMIQLYRNSDYSGFIANTTPPNCTGYGRIFTKLDQVVRIIEEKDCTPEQRNIKIVNSGIYLYNIPKLFENIHLLDCNNIQNEYYITDMVHILHNKGYKIGTYHVKNYNELLNVNTRDALLEANKINKSIN